MDQEASVNGQRRAEASRFLRYCVVGSAGFCIDAAVLLALVHGLSFNPIFARLFSFSIAVLFTFELNRLWTFGSLRRQRMFSAFAAYVGVQGVGFLCNLGLYTLAILTLPEPLNAPLFCLAIGSVSALAVNYTGSKHLAFGVKAPLPDRAVGAGGRRSREQ
jgi:putative flippase GtrA